MHMKTLAALAATTVLALGAAACGGSDDEAASATTKTKQAEPAVTPVAEIPALTGKDTAVTLDAGFVEALGSLKLTPAPLGTAEISKENLLTSFNSDNQNTMINQFFFQGKANELIKIFSKAPPQDKLRVSGLLQKIDITNATRYKDELK